MKHKILFVDDEENVLYSLKRILRTSGFELLTAASGKEGVAILEKTAVSVVVTDMKMPEMNGTEFLKRAKEICPNSIRIILSGYAEVNSIMDAINEGSIWRFIPKPWNNDELKIALKNALELYEKEEERKLLVDALREKTIQLEDSNRTLEKKVEKRTWLLNERSQLLTMLVEDQGIEVILWRACSGISKFLSGKPVYIIPSFLEHIYSVKEGEATGDTLSPLLSELLKKVLDRNKTMIMDNSIGILLRKGKTSLGVLIIGSLTENESAGIVESIPGFISFLNISLFQYKLSGNTPQLLENIDKLMGYV